MSAEHAEIRRRYLRAGDSLDWTAVERQWNRRQRSHRAERTRALAPRSEILFGNNVAIGAASAVALPQRDELVRARVRERANENSVHEAEDCAAAADPKRERQNNRGSEAGVFSQHAKRICGIARAVVQRSEATRIAAIFLVSLHAAEIAQRGRVRILGRHSVSNP